MKKFTAVLLCVAMLFSCMSVVGFAGNTKTVSKALDTSVPGVSSADYPIVFVTGIGQSYSYFYADENDTDEYYTRLEEVKNGKTTEVVDGKTVEYRETDTATTRWNLFCNDFSFAFKEFGTYTAILPIVGGLLLSQIGINCIPRKSVDKLVNILFRYNLIDNEGKLPKNVITPRADCSVAEMTAEQKDNFYRSIPCQDLVEGIGEDMIYCFNYSAFSFTYDNADALNTFIKDVVLPQTGKDKVVLVPMSMGASVVSAYLQRYGIQQKASGSEFTQVARVVSIVGAWDGSDVFADLIELKYSEDAPEKLYNGIVAELVGEPWGYLVNVVLRIFPKKTLRSIIDEILDSIVCNLILKTPSLLALIPKDRYEQIRADRLAGNEELAYILKMTDEYYECQKGLDDRLKKLNTLGADFYYLAGYGLGFGEYSSDYRFFGFLRTADTTNSDEIIQISSTATRATYATKGTELKDYNADYVTPDKSVDLSTCIFPDNVWLFKGQKHELENNNTALRLALDLACGNEAKARAIYPKFNESRDLKKLKRDYLPQLTAYVIAKAGLTGEDAENFSLQDWAEAGGDITVLTAAQIKTLKEVYAMIDSVQNNRTEDDKVIEALYNMMCDLGIYTKSEEKSEDFFTKVLKKNNEIVYKIFGAKGFADLFKKNV